MNKRALVTGATGYVGGRLVSRLLEEGFQVRVMARNLDKLRDYPWIDQVEVVQADAEVMETLPKSLESIDCNSLQNLDLIELVYQNTKAKYLMNPYVVR